MSARVLCHMDCSDTIIYVSQKAQTVPGQGKATPVGISYVRPQSDMRCYRLDRCDLESWSRHVHISRCTKLLHAMIKAGHNGGILASIMHTGISNMLMWQRIKEERGLE